ncbi:hypothetical protein [Herpetosiphon giganteus]|uniref:hypothetical protein n=1 Tax=Herpetosiphon giganteus TaxID=2029754 RepID=UPI00195612E1|nr:hypothetical protein [Herpetosiphon giganteus]MBM7843183.1 cytochrome c553 [Herpetosiphon giganteus]
MSDAPEMLPDEQPDAAPVFDKEAARARYRAMMRSWPMRLMFAMTGLVIVATWVFAFGAAYGPDVKELPGHDVTVAVAECKTCHNAGLPTAPSFNHSFAPTCGFCHVQGMPPTTPLTSTSRLR